MSEDFRLERMPFSLDMWVAAKGGWKTMTRRRNRRWLKLEVGDVLVATRPWWVYRRYDHMTPSELPDSTEVMPRPTGLNWRKRAAMHFPLHLADQMPWLRVEEVREERLGDITPLEAQREGSGHWEEEANARHVSEFRDLWERINGEWDGDERVVVIGFQLLELDPQSKRWELERRGIVEVSHGGTKARRRKAGGA